MKNFVLPVLAVALTGCATTGSYSSLDAAYAGTESRALRCRMNAAPVCHEAIDKAVGPVQVCECAILPNAFNQRLNSSGIRRRR